MPAARFSFRSLRPAHPGAVPPGEAPVTAIIRPAAVAAEMALGTSFTRALKLKGQRPRHLQKQNHGAVGDMAAPKPVHPQPKQATDTAVPTKDISDEAATENLLYSSFTSR